MRLNTIDWIAYALAIIGGLNWGLIGAFDFNLVAAIFGEMSALSRIIYIWLCCTNLSVKAFSAI